MSEARATSELQDTADCTRTPACPYSRNIGTIAAQYRPEAYRFTGRFGAGFLVYFLVVNVVVTRFRALIVMVVAALSASVVSLIGILEYARISFIVGALDSFRVSPFYMVGQPRITSTLQYPTITSMYLEIAFGFVLSLFILLTWKNRAYLAGVVGVLVVLIGVCILLTLTRVGAIHPRISAHCGHGDLGLEKRMWKGHASAYAQHIDSGNGLAGTAQPSGLPTALVCPGAEKLVSGPVQGSGTAHAKGKARLRNRGHHHQYGPDAVVLKWS